MWKCLYEKITECVTNGCILHLSRLLSLLISIVQIHNGQIVYGELCNICIYQCFFLHIKTSVSFFLFRRAVKQADLSQIFGYSSLVGLLNVLFDKGHKAKFQLSFTLRLF